MAVVSWCWQEYSGIYFWLSKGQWSKFLHHNVGLKSALWVLRTYASWILTSAFIGSGLRREYGSRRPCSCTRPLMELCHHTWVNWFVSPICLVDVPSALLRPIVCCAVRVTVYHRRPGLPSRRSHHLEQPAGQRAIIPISVNFCQRLKTFLFQASFPDIIIDAR